MRFEKKKLGKMIDELSTYCLEKGSTDIKLELVTEPDRYIFKVEAMGVQISQKDMDQLKNKLNSHREVEMEEYCWSLAGESLTQDELSLVASMTDSGDIYLEQDVLHIQLVRLKHSK